MPTTSYVSPTVSANTIGARTDSAGVAVVDLSAEEARFVAILLTEGYVTPTTAFRVQAQTVPDMTVKVGSGSAKADYYAVAGDVAGQGNYIVRLDVASQNVTISAADASQARTDEIYLVVRDNVYDASSRALPQLGYRQGDLGGANPGPDTTWKASVLLARVAVAAAATSITSGNITDQRVAAGLLTSHTHTQPAVRFPPATLTDGATVNTDASLGDYFRLSAGGNRTLAAPTSPTDGQVATWEILASGAARTITLATGSAGAFAFGSDIPALTQTVSAKRDLLRAVYNSTAARWLVVAYVKGF